jgi:hypothetical protein
MPPRHSHYTYSTAMQTREPGNGIMRSEILRDSSDQVVCRAGHRVGAARRGGAL